MTAALTQGPTPGVDSLNAHFDYSRLLPADDNTSGAGTDLFTTADIRDALSSFAGRLLFSMGCHSGLDVDDAEVAASGLATPVDDWAKTFADAGALWVGNTGYGYADTDTIAYSAKLMADFAADLDGPLSVGEALTASQATVRRRECHSEPVRPESPDGVHLLRPAYVPAQPDWAQPDWAQPDWAQPDWAQPDWAQPDWAQPDWGQPDWAERDLPDDPGAAAPSPDVLPTAVVDQDSGLTDLSAPVSVNLGVGSGPGQLGLVTTANGDYYQVNATTAYGGTQTTEYRPVEPLVDATVSEPGLVPHGALVTALSSSDVADPTPLYSMPSAGSAGATPPAIGYAAFPGTLQRVATYGTFSASGAGEAAQLDLVAGQFIPNTSSPGAGTERLFNSISAQVYYLPLTSPYAEDFTPPTIDSTEASDPGATLNFEVQVSPSVAPVRQVLILYTDASAPGTWQVVNLSSSNGQTWTASAVPPASGQVQYVVEALDAAGNVAVSNNEGTAFDASAQPAVAITLSGNGPTNGFFTGPVMATITAPAGSTYILDGSMPLAVPEDGVITVGSSGEHTLTVTDPQGDVVTQAFAISLYQTTTTPSTSVSVVVVGQSVTVTASVNPATAGIGSPTGNVEFFDGATPIAACGAAQGTPLSSSGKAVCTFTYAAIGAHQITAHYLGDTSFAGSTSSPTGLTVDPRTATVSAFQVNGSPSTFGAEQGLVFSATVTPGDGDPFPTGDTVTVALGHTALCTIALVPGSGDSGSGNSGSGTSGSGSCSPSSGTLVAAGSYSDVTATFNETGADPDFQVTPPATLQLVVEGATTVTPPPPSTPPPPTVQPTPNPTTAPVAKVSITWAPPAPITFGTRLTSAQLDATASMPGVFRYSPSIGTVLQPGTQALEVTFTPTATPYAISTTATATISVGFTGSCISKVHSGPLVVAKGHAVCARQGARINGDISIASGGALFMSGGTIGGSLHSSGALAITLCGTTVTGPVSVATTSGPVTIGGPGCAGDTIGTAPVKLSISGNADGVRLTGSRVTGPTTVTANEGGTTISGNVLSGGTVVTDNRDGCAFTNNKVSGPLVISGNTGAFKFSGNTVHGAVRSSANS